MLIGITGTDGAGKGTVVDYLVKKKGFVHCSARAIWLREIAKQGIEPTRANMRIVANEMREAYGNDFLITYYVQELEKTKPKHVAIESIRALAEVETLKGHGGILIAVDADQRIRYARVQERRSESDRVTFEEFTAHEELEANDPNPHGMQKQKVLQMADYTLMNNGSVEDLYTEIDRVYESLLKNTE